MARVKNRTTGVVVEVADEKVELLPRFDWEPVSEAKKAPVKSDSK